jgi:hypothetical protein
MKYYKSKRGYFYKMVGDKKTRISIEEYKSMKGGKLEAYGELDKTNFSQIIEIPSLRVRNNNKNLIELQPMTSENVINNIDFSNIPEPKIMRQKGFRKEPYIFFGYNPSTGKYRYVFYNDTRWFKNNEIICTSNQWYKKEVICKQLIGNRINTLSHSEITSIELKYLVHLYLFLLNKRETEPDFMERLFTYLYNIIKFKITRSGTTQYHNRVARYNTIKFLPKNYNKIKFINQFL